MKKIILLSFIFAVAMMFNSSDVSAQSFEQGDINVGGGIGLGNNTIAGGTGITAHAEFGVTEVISVGGYLAFSGTNYLGFRRNSLVIGGRGAYHFNELLTLPDELDLYAGLGLYYEIVSSDLDGYIGPGNRLLFGVHLGGRYYFTDNIGAFAELGSAVSVLQLGVTIKL